MNLTLNRIDLSPLRSVSNASTIKERRLPYSFVLDGSNILRDNSNLKFAKISDVIHCKEKLKSYGIPDENVFIIFGAGIQSFQSFLSF